MADIDKKLSIISKILAGIGLLDSLYLTYVKFANAYAICGPIGDCESVNSSQYSEVAGIPIALFGAAAYAVILALLFLEGRYEFMIDFSSLLVFGISLAGVLYSAYLTYIEIAVLKAICPYCVLSAIALVSIMILAIIRLVRGQSDLKVNLRD